MKGFDEIAAEAFQRGDNGKWVFFPRTRFFSGYEVPDEACKQELQEKMSEFLELTLWLVLAGMVIAGCFGKLLLGSMSMEVAVLAATHRFASRTTRGLNRSGVRYDPEKARALFVNSRSVRRLVGITGLSIVMTFFAVYAIELQPRLWMSILPGVLVLSFISVIYVRMTRTKLTLRSMQSHGIQSHAIRVHAID